MSTATYKAGTLFMRITKKKLGNGHYDDIPAVCGERFSVPEMGSNEAPTAVVPYTPDRKAYYENVFGQMWTVSAPFDPAAEASMRELEELRAQKAALEAQREQESAGNSNAELEGAAEVITHTCETCGFEAKSALGLSAHMRVHDNK